MHFAVLVVGNDHDGQLDKFNEDKHFIWHDTHEEVQKYFQHYGSDGQTLYDFAEGDGYIFNEELGRWGRHSNPNAKWDWYQVGGRYTLCLKAKEGKRGEPSLLMMDSYFEEASKPENLNRFDQCVKKDLLEEPVFYAFLKDGVWTERCDEDDDVWSAKFKELMATVDENETITVVDCHI